VIGGSEPFRERSRHGRVLTGRNQHVGEECPRPADKLAHPKPEAAADRKRERPDQAVSSIGDVNRQLRVTTVMAPPFEKP